MEEEISRYRTVDEMGRGIYRDKGSRFLGFVMGVVGVQDALKKVAECRETYHDARHVCWAYLTDEGERCQDDGEPSGTAGVVILGVLKGSGLQNVLCVVVRYFGGILLGVGGLRVAYKEAARLALETCGVVERTRMERRVLEVKAAEAGVMSQRVYGMRDAGLLRVLTEEWLVDGGVRWEVDMAKGGRL